MKFGSHMFAGTLVVNSASATMEMHQQEMGKGQTVTFNGTGRGSFSGPQGPVTAQGRSSHAFAWLQ